MTYVPLDSSVGLLERSYTQVDIFDFFNPWGPIYRL